MSPLFPGGASPLTLAHDQNGNLTDDGTYLYFYDIENRCTQVKLKSGTVLLADYHYDALGRRIRKIIPTGQPDAGTWTYVVNELWQVVSEYKTVSSTTTHQRRYVQAGQSAYVDDHVAMWDIVAAKLFYYHANAQYCTVAMTYTAGAVEERYVTDPYGKTVTYTSAWGTPQATSRIGNPFMHQGLWLDAECGKYQNRYREYLPSIGGFANRDPLLYEDGANLYEYLMSRPLLELDPTGEMCQVGTVCHGGGNVAAGAKGGGGAPTLPVPTQWHYAPTGPNDVPVPCGPGQIQQCTAYCQSINRQSGDMDCYQRTIVLPGGISITLWGNCLCAPLDTGDCTAQEQVRLQLAVNLACKIPRKCTGAQTCDELKANLAKNLICEAARNRINNKCYKGGDPGHQNAANDARKAAATCRGFLKSKKCPGIY